MKIKKKGMALLLILGMLPSIAYSQSVQWMTFAQGKNQAKLEKKKIMIHFVTNWCRYCKEMEKTTFKNPETLAYLNRHFISIRVDGEKEKKLAQQFKVAGYPDTRFFDKDMNQAYRVPGLIAPIAFKFFLEYIHSNAYQTMDPMSYYKSRK